MSQQDLTVPVIAIDGGAGTGKGTARAAIAEILGYHTLDSGVLYRALGLVCAWGEVTRVEDMVARAQKLELTFEGQRIIINDVDETVAVRSDEAGALASSIAMIPEVRAALLDYQLHMRVWPGLVTDGRDQGFIFDTPYRYFFTCAPEVRARRRVSQLAELGIVSSYETVLEEIIRRDEADRTRATQPLRPHPEAIIIDTSDSTIDQVVERVMANYLIHQ